MKTKNISTEAQTIDINIIDWSTVNKNLTARIHEMDVEAKKLNIQYEIASNYVGYYYDSKKEKGLLISRDANVYSAKHNDNSGEETFRIPVYRKTEKGIIAVAPEFHSNLTYKTIEDSQNGNYVSLLEFMGDRYKHNERIEFNEYRLFQIIRDL